MEDRYKVVKFEDETFAILDTLSDKFVDKDTIHKWGYIEQINKYCKFNNIKDALKLKSKTVPSSCNSYHILTDLEIEKERNEKRFLVNFKKVFI